MVKKLLVSSIILFLSIGTAYAQEHTISGTIKDRSNGEEAPYVTVRVKELTGVGTTSNAYGFYSITLERGSYTLLISSLGFKTLEQPISLEADTTLHLALEVYTQTLDEVIISSKNEEDNLTSIDGSKVEIDMRTLHEVPTFGGEPDIIRVAQLSPGIKTAGEGNAGFYVRGGGLDQNLVLLDEAPVYSPSHMLGVFSVFNGDALKSASIYKGGMSAEYGGRTASVMDIRMKEGNAKEYNMSGGVGLIASRLTVEGPIVEDKSSFIISGRRSYADLFFGLSSDSTINNSTLYFYDLNLKANYSLGEKDKMYVSGYFGRDAFAFVDNFGMNWGNATGTLRWNHIVNEKLFSNTSLIYNSYFYDFRFEERGLNLLSTINDINIKQDFSYYLNNRNTLSFGLNAIHHTMEPGSILVDDDSGLTDDQAELANGIESAVYAQNEFKISEQFQLSFGLRFSMFHRLGSGTSYEFDSSGNILSSTFHDEGDLMQFYNGLEPRLSATYRIDNSSSLKLLYNRNNQYLHLISNSTSLLPSDIWILSSNNVKPQIADQLSIGYHKNLNDNMFQASTEVYYKYMQNAIDYRDGADIFVNEALEGELVYGTGQAYGLEFLFKKTKGQLTGWLGYTLAKTTRQFDEINDGLPFSARQDRTHDLSVVLNYKFNPKWTVSANFVYYTGDAVTFPTGKYTYDGITVPLYSGRNAERMPDYHRLDLGLTWYNKSTDKFESNWNFSLYNAYGRENAYSITVGESETIPGQFEATQLSLFRWIPSITYNFKFK
ncbi:MAG: TonB-dependent receptor [Bacteroidota bacterium]